MHRIRRSLAQVSELPTRGSIAFSRNVSRETLQAVWEASGDFCRIRIAFSRWGSGTSSCNERHAGLLSKSFSSSPRKPNSTHQPPASKKGSPSRSRCEIATPREVKTRHRRSSRLELVATCLTSTRASLQPRSRTKARRNAAFFSEDSSRIRGLASRQTTPIGTPGKPFPDPRSSIGPSAWRCRSFSPARMPSRKCLCAISDGSSMAVRFIFLPHAWSRRPCDLNSCNCLLFNSIRSFIAMLFISSSREDGIFSLFGEWRRWVRRSIRPTKQGTGGLRNSADGGG